MKTIKDIQSEISNLDSVGEELKLAKESKEKLASLTSAVNREEKRQEELALKNDVLFKENEELTQANKALVEDIKQQENVVCATKKKIIEDEKERIENEEANLKIQNKLNEEMERSEDSIIVLKKEEDDLRATIDSLAGDIRDKM